MVNGAFGSHYVRWYVAVMVFVALALVIVVLAVGYLGLHDPKALAAILAVLDALLTSVTYITHPSGNGRNG